MTLEWMKKQAPWVIGTFGIMILVGLVMMDRAGSYRSDRHHNIVGSVNGEEIPTERFQAELKNYLRGQEAQNGKAPEGLQLAQIREGMFNYKVQSMLMQKVFTENQLYASPEEMMDFVKKHPQDVAQNILRYKGYEELPQFLADSSIDPARYENWLAQDSIYNRISMRELEENLRSSVIPQMQLQAIMKTQIHRTALEEGFTIAMRENKAKLKFYRVALDSFRVSPEKFKETELKAYYEAHPDSFYFKEDAARLGYLRIPLKPSKTDSNLMRDFAKELKERIANGEKFADLAKDYSNDPSTADKGGKLDGLRSRSDLDPAIANVAFSLKPGEVSNPVLSSLGYHVILVTEHKKVDTTDKIEVSHIMLKISSGTETIDSLMEVAEKVRAAAQKDGLEKVAKDFGQKYDKSPIFEKNNFSPLPSGYVQGANSFAFSSFEAKEKISEALQSEDGIYLFERDGTFEKGRSFDRAKLHIADILAKEEKVAEAKKELESQRASILAAADNALPARVGKAVLDSTASGPISADNWLPGYGYSSPALFKTLTQTPGQWGNVLTTEVGASMAKVSERAFLSENEIQDRAKSAMSQNDGYQFSGLYQEWVANLPKSAKVENKMDLVFRN